MTIKRSHIERLRRDALTDSSSFAVLRMTLTGRGRGHDLTGGGSPSPTAVGGGTVRRDEGVPPYGVGRGCGAAGRGRPALRRFATGDGKRRPYDCGRGGGALTRISLPQSRCARQLPRKAVEPLVAPALQTKKTPDWASFFVCELSQRACTAGWAAGSEPCSSGNGSWYRRRSC